MSFTLALEELRIYMLQATPLTTGLWKIVDPEPSSLTPVKMCATGRPLYLVH